MGAELAYRIFNVSHAAIIITWTILNALVVDPTALNAFLVSDALHAVILLQQHTIFIKDYVSHVMLLDASHVQQMIFASYARTAFIWRDSNAYIALHNALNALVKQTVPAAHRTLILTIQNASHVVRTASNAYTLRAVLLAAL